MTEEKVKSIIEAMQGITYQEWKKLSHVIDVYFNNEIAMQGNKIPMADPEVIMDSYKRLF